MGGRLSPPLLLLLLFPLLLALRLPPGAAGLEPTEPSLPRPPRTLSFGWAEPPRGSWDPGPTPRAPAWHPSPAASPAVETPAGSSPAERTSEAGRREQAKPPTPTGSSGQSPPVTMAATETSQARLSCPASPAGAVVHGSSPASPSGGLSAAGVPGGQRATSPGQELDTRGQVGVHQPVAEPRSQAPEAAGTVTVPPSLDRVSSPRRQAEGARPPHMELPGLALAAVGQLDTGAPLPGPSGGQEDVAALPELTRSASMTTRTAGPEEFLGQPAGGETDGESGRKPDLHPTSARPPEPSSAVGLLLPGTALPESPAPLRSSVGPEDVTPADSPRSVGPAAPRKMSLGQRTSLWEQQGRLQTPSAGRGAEATPHFTPSSSSAAVTSALNPDSLPYRTGHTLDASQSAPSPSPPSGQGGLSRGPTGVTGSLGKGQESRWSPVAFQTSRDPLTVPGRESLRAPSAPGTHQSPEPFSSTLSDPAQSSPVLVHHPPNWGAEGGTSSNPASSSRATSAAGTDQRAGSSSDSQRRPPTATPWGSFPRQAASSQASRPAGETTGTAEPTVRLALGKGEPAPWRPPGPTDSQASSAPAASAAREGAADSGPPRPPFRTALFSSCTSAATMPTSRAGETEALGQIPVTHQSRSTPARTWRRSQGGHAPESPGREPPPSPPLPTAAGKRWPTWPWARGDLPVASTWLLAVVPEAATQLAPATPREVRPRVQHVFVAENRPPVLKAAFVHLPWELVLAVDFPGGFGSPHSPEYQGLLLSINTTVAPLFAPLPGFQRLEVKSIWPGSVLVLLDALFLAEAPGLWAALNRPGLPKQPPPGLGAANTSVAWSLALKRPLDLCAELFACPAGYDCVVGEDGNATCASVCHRPYCKNQGICTHIANQTPVCQCPVGSDFWFLGVRCDYRVTQQGLLGGACGLLLSLLLIGAAVFGLVVRRVRMLLLEARADQTKSSYRRFCRLDDVSAHYWSEPWLASVNSLDNPAFSNSEELLHLQTLEPPRCSCQDGCPAAEGYRKPLQGAPSHGAADRPRSLCSWERRSGSGNNEEHMIDSGKASEVSVSSCWPLEPAQWSPSPAPHGHGRQPTHKGQRPQSDCEGTEMVSLERSWTA